MEKQQYFEVTITNGIWEQTEQVSVKSANNDPKLAEKMVNGLINREWSVVEGKTKLV